MIDHLLLAAEIISAISIIVGVIVSAKKRRKQQREHEERIDNANRCLLRSKIVDIYYRYKECGKIRQYQRENLDLLYAGYKELGGNSFVDTIYETMKEWEVVT